MTKACVRDDACFGVCRIVQGDEVRPAAPTRRNSRAVGTLARFENWDMPEQGILHVSAVGGTRFEVRSHATQTDGLIVADVASLRGRSRESAVGARFQPLAQLLELLAARVDPRQFPR
mgnify:CR=1 FL=1